MHTVTFYSYKGGVGRTLVVANLAKYLAHLRMKVLVLDLDLEAPGVHYKLGERGARLPVERGVVDILHAFATTGQLPENLADYVLEAPAPTPSAGKIHLLAAGDAPSPEYWKKLSRIDWHSLFYSEQPDGIPLFLELKAFIEETYSPDFLLIDARTGITEMGGVATTVLADQVVCVMLPTREHLEGTREVMRAIRATPRMDGAGPVELLAVLSRLPHAAKGSDETAEVGRVKDFLNAPVDSLGASVEIGDLAVLHREPALEAAEQILVGGERNLDESRLLLDYLRLFVKLVPPAQVGKSVGHLIEDIKAQVMTSPDAAEQAIEELANGCLHPEAYRALLSMYRLRRSPMRKRIEAAYALWRINGDANEPLLWEAIKDYDLDSYEHGELPSLDRIEAVEAVWRARGIEDSRMALAIADTYRALGVHERAASVLASDLALPGSPSVAAVVRLVELRLTAGQRELARHVIEQFRLRFSKNPSFVEVCAKCDEGAPL